MLCGTFALGNSGSLLLRTLPESLCIRTADRAECAWLRELIGMMRQECDAPGPGGTAIVGELSSVLFTVLLRTLIADGSLSQGILALMSDTRLARAVDAVLRQPEQDWTIASLAERCNLSRAAFARQFSDLSGLTPMELVTALRMERAGQLLAQENMAGGIVAERCGYASQAAFTRVFKTHFGMNPGAYRKRTQEARLQPRYRSSAALSEASAG
jgi:AraC family transcriptional activator of mtrCDE